MSNTLNRGDKMTFGRYPQGIHGESALIEWYVLTVLNNNQALLISDKLIDVKEYQNNSYDYDELTWETCSLREWLNNSFMNKAFDKDEQSRIALVLNDNPENPVFGTDGGYDTSDRIFALSIDEFNDLVPYDKRKGMVTPYTKQRISFIQGMKKEGISPWWLRSPGDNTNSMTSDRVTASFVDCGGNVCYKGSVVNNELYIAVRPALWLKL